MRRYRIKLHNLFYFWVVVDAVHALPTSLAGGYIRNAMSDFPLGVAAPEGAQKLVDVCKGTWAVIEDRESELDVHNRAVES
jgi:hypothetical protein